MFLEHYSALGVTRKLLALHALDDSDARAAQRLRTTAHAYDAQVVEMNVGPWDEALNESLRDYVRSSRDATSWHVLADVDEFHQYPAAIDVLIEGLEAQSAAACSGILLDRFALDGKLLTLPGELAELDRRFPLGGFFTGTVVGGDPRKIVIAKQGTWIAPGQHWSDGEALITPYPILVHHFKWHEGVVEYLSRRQQEFLSGRWEERTPAMRKEAGAVLELIAAPGDQIMLEQCGVSLENVSLASSSKAVLDQGRALHGRWCARFDDGTAKG